MHRHPIVTICYVLTDVIAAMLSWSLFFRWRKQVVIPDTSWTDVFADDRYAIGLIVISMMWVAIMAFVGSYRSVIQAGRLSMLYETVVAMVIGAIVVLLLVVADDDTLGYTSYVWSFVRVLSYSLVCFVAFRFVYLSIIHAMRESGRLTLNTILIGDRSVQRPYQNQLYHLSSIDQLYDITDLSQIEEVVLDDATDHNVKQLYEHLYRCAPEVIVELRGDDISTLIGSDSVSYNVMGDRLLMIIDRMPYWQQHSKRVIDVLISIVALVLLSPLYVVLAFLVKKGSSGPVIYRQVRLGRRAESFHILKFRTMINEAERDGPELSYIGDDRVTEVGRWMRRYRLDELPQFWNVLRGDMSIVGPRPERPYYTERLRLEIMHYNRIFLVRPGITSWGQVKYGYASDVAQMIKRLRFDILYLQNRSLFLDFKIMLFTLSVLIKGEGR